MAEQPAAEKTQYPTFRKTAEGPAERASATKPGVNVGCDASGVSGDGRSVGTESDEMVHSAN